MTKADHVVKNQSSVIVHGFDDVFRRPQACDDYRNLMFDTGLHIRIQAFVTFVHDLVHGKRCNRMRRA